MHRQPLRADPVALARLAVAGGAVLVVDAFAPRRIGMSGRTSQQQKCGNPQDPPYPNFRLAEFKKTCSNRHSDCNTSEPMLDRGNQVFSKANQ
jgi:hypothetical protein